MPSIFDTFNILKRAMGAQQYAINTTAHNISNADTDGYSRQRVTLETSRPEGAASLNSSSGPGQLGTGVEVSDITRIRDLFLDVQIRNETSTKGQFEARNEFLSEVETLYLEPSDEGLSTSIGNMWDSWQNLANNPESSNARTDVVEASSTLTSTLNHLYTQFTNLQEHSKDLISGKVDDFNTILTEIKGLNKQIKGITITGDKPNDLLDKQDKLIDDLSQIANIDVKRDQYGQVTIMVGDTNVTADDGPTLSYTPTGGLKWKIDDTTYIDATDDFKNGSIYGYMTIGSDMGVYIDDLNKLTCGLAAAVNIIQEDGTSIPFFVKDGTTSSDGIDASNITVNPDIINNLSNINTKADPVNDAIGNGDRALAIAKLKDTRLDFQKCATYSDAVTYLETSNYDAASMAYNSDSNGTTTDGFFRDMVVKIGSDAKTSNTMVSSQDALLQQLDLRKESISGVSIDEEMANLIQYQHAYAAAAKALSTMSDLLDAVINIVR